jgi:hypothetical protein
MTNAAFSRPVIMLVGLGFPRLLKNSMDALQVLEDLNSAYHDPAYFAAVDACRGAIAGNVRPELARGLVEAFASEHGMLADVSIEPTAIARARNLQLA